MTIDRSVLVAPCNATLRRDAVRVERDGAEIQANQADRQRLDKAEHESQRILQSDRSQ